jgi:1,5-anhydro-D-fructose reductase (1,5-anhydro-D-mannitol-forming)
MSIKDELTVKNIRIGFLGFGKMGNIRYQTFKQMEQCEALAVYEYYDEIVTPENLKRVNSAEEIITSKDLNTVVISVPNYLIKPYVIASIESGKHVFCEKPPGINLSEVMAMKKALTNSGCKLMFGFNHRHHKSIIKAKEVVSSGRFGDILWMRGRYGKSVPKSFFQDWRSKKQFAGGGIFLDQGIHMLDLFMNLVGKFDEVKSFVSNLYWKGDVEDNVFALFKNNKGQVASLHSTMTQWRHLFSLEIFLEHGYIALNGLKTSSNSYGKEKLTIAMNRTDAPAAAWSDEEQHTFSTDDSWERELTIFRDAILHDRPIDTCGVEDAIQLMEMVDKVYSQ